MKTRRHFLKSSLAYSSLVSFSGIAPQVLLRASEQTVGKTDENILVVVQLAGGNDGLNTVIPYGDDEYYKNRFTLAIGRNQVQKINDHLGFHPALSGFSELLENNQLNVLQGVGYPNPNRSHFESMDLWHTAHLPANPIRIGWLGRYIESGLAEESLPAIHFGQEEQPLALAAKSTAVPSIRSTESFRLKAFEESSIKRNLDSLIRAQQNSQENNSLLGFIHENTNVAVATSHKLDSIRSGSQTTVNYPDNSLGRKLQSIAELIGSGLKTRIYYVVLDGFDTHSNQADAHQGLLSELGSSVAAFMKHLEEQGNHERVAVMTFSEFGRRVRENASRGTDHGTSAPLFIAGGNIQSGITGNNPDFSNLKDGDFKFEIDYRRVYATILEKWMGMDSGKVLGKQYKLLDLFG